MAKIKPFCGVRFNAKGVGRLSKVVCPPYDVINKQQRQGYIKKSKYNAVSLVLPKGKNKLAGHRNSKKALGAWLEKGILIRDKQPSLYVYLQRYKIDGATKSRLGFISLLELEDIRKKKVLPHEKIFDKFKFERFDLMKTTQAHLSPIFFLFNDKARKVEGLLSLAVRNRKPLIDINTEGVKEKLWRIQNSNFISGLRRLMSKKIIFIADGHHRFEASVILRDYLREKQRHRGHNMPYDYTMAYFLSMQNKGLAILPIHRTVKYLPDNFSKRFMLKELSKYFSIDIMKSKKKLLKKLQMIGKQEKHAFGFFYNNTYIFAVLEDNKIISNIGSLNNCLSWKRLDVSILHYFIFPKLLNIKERVNRKRNIYYYRGASSAVRMVKSGEFEMAIFLNPTKIEQVESIAKSNNRMPHKSTYF
ncbi:MAG: DUF1015 domain-containing protein, partial [Candidatus Omnitrophota bacterium]